MSPVDRSRLLALHQFGRYAIMSLLHQFLTVEQLRELDPQQFEILKNALTHAIRTNEQVQRALYTVVREVYDQLTQETATSPTPPPPAPAPQRRRKK
jgi:hypothetical protein